MVEKRSLLLVGIAMTALLGANFRGCTPDPEPECEADTDCPIGELCNDDGVCEGVFCPQVWAPVCGVDGQTYGNACTARVAHVEIAHLGQCECRSDEECPEGLVCGDDGTCVEAIQCVMGGTIYQPGDEFPSEDGCNTCRCDENGMIACTERACVCVVDDVVYQPGDEFPSSDGCNTCECMADGGVACTLRACVCAVDDVVYQPGDVFPSSDGCNTCECMADGRVACTERACACDPESEWQRHYVGIGEDQCAVIRFACPENTEYFANACGCGCEQDPSCPRWFNCMPGPNVEPCNPAEIHRRCPYSEIAW